MGTTRELYYIELVGDRYAMCAVSYKSLGDAQEAFQRECSDPNRTAFKVRLYDCSLSPVGTLIKEG